tara:strand:+ start:1293 stop:2003 length:711 start_codon:yes stop_codon:yes gene_type:complete
MKKSILRRFYEFIRDKVNTRVYENKVAYKFLKNCDSILDIGCGTGVFIAMDPKRIKGTDYNNLNVDVCIKKGYDAVVGNALDLPFKDNTFDGVYLAHVLHIFNSNEAYKCMQEMIRVVKPDGIIVINTLGDYKRKWIHAENARPYPPMAIRGMFNVPNPDTETSPVVTGLPSDVKQHNIWFRRPALFDLISHASYRLNGLYNLLNGIQYSLFLRKYWKFDAYIIALKNSKKINFNS